MSPGIELGTSRLHWRPRTNQRCHPCSNYWKLALFLQSLINKPFLSSKNSHFQDEADCKTFLVFQCMRITNHFHINGFALSLALKQRLQATREWPRITAFIVYFLMLTFRLDVNLDTFLRSLWSWPTVDHKLSRWRAWYEAQATTEDDKYPITTLSCSTLTNTFGISTVFDSNLSAKISPGWNSVLSNKSVRTLSS